MIGATRHAETRVRQRGIPPAIVEWLLSYGESRHDHHGGVLFYFDSKARARLQRSVERESLARHARKLDCYAVMSMDGTILTVGYRVKRFKLDCSQKSWIRKGG